METNKIVSLAIEAIQNKIPNAYADKKETSEVLRKAFIDANGGSNIITAKTFRRNPALFDIIEEIIPSMVQEGLMGDEFFMNFVDYRNLSLGDQNEFWAEDKSLFVVANAAEGTQGIRRQRLDVGEKVTISTSLKVIKFFDELNRFMANRVDFDTLVNKTSKSMLAKYYADIYTAFNGIAASTVGMSSDYYKTGSYSEDTLLTLVEHVEAATGAPATLLGARSALRKVTQAVVSDSAKEDVYGLGYYGKFNGVPMVAAKQRHAVGTDSFILDDSKVYVVAGGDKFIKGVDEGEGLLIEGEAINNADLTKDYLYGQRTGFGILIAGRLGVYDIG